MRMRTCSMFWPVSFALAVGLTLCLLDLLLGILSLTHYVLALSIQIIWHHRIILMRIAYKLAPVVLVIGQSKLIVILGPTSSFRRFMEITLEVLPTAAIQITIFVELFQLCLSWRLLLYFLLGQYWLRLERLNISSFSRLVESIHIVGSSHVWAKVTLNVWILRILNLAPFLRVFVHWTDERRGIESTSKEQVVVKWIVDWINCRSLWESAHVKLLFESIWTVFWYISKSSKWIER